MVGAAPGTGLHTALNTVMSESDNAAYVKDQLSSVSNYFQSWRPLVSPSATSFGAKKLTP